MCGKTAAAKRSIRLQGAARWQDTHKRGSSYGDSTAPHKPHNPLVTMFGMPGLNGGFPAAPAAPKFKFQEFKESPAFTILVNGSLFVAGIAFIQSPIMDMLAPQL
ncbi:Tom6 protein [Maudiozyma humilis]|uniref:Tom6 protein n=1 Tax=Maudiozyma humilis TaxID=51915 RepID=A0AAV5RPT7_MAUHU|nr:Tom6 protein [Kazachstania humilis]